MADNGAIEQLTVRTLSHVVGNDGTGQVGRQPMNTLVPTSRQVVGGRGTRGGGKLSGDITIELNDQSVASLDKADTAMQPSVYDPDNVGGEMAFQSTSVLLVENFSAAPTTPISGSVQKVLVKDRRTSFDPVETEPAHDLKFENDGKWFAVQQDGTDLYAAGGTVSPSIDDAVPLANLVRYGSISGNSIAIPAGTIAATPQDITSIDGDLIVQSNGVIQNFVGASATQRLLYLKGDDDHSIKWRGGRFDQNAGAFSCLEISNFDFADVAIEEASGIICTPSSTNSTSGLVFANVDRGRASWSRMSDMSKGTSDQGSLPRCFSVSRNDGGTSNIEVFLGECENVHGVIVVGDIGGGVINTYGGVVKNAADNVIYNVGDASEVNCFDLIADGVDEIFVNHGTGWINAYRTVAKNLNNSIGLQDCGGVRISGANLKFSSGVPPFRTRPTLGAVPGNTASGPLIVENSVIECTPAERVMDFGSNGTIKEITFRHSTIIINYDSSVATGTGDGFWTVMTSSFPADGRISIDDTNTIILRDANGDIPNNLRVNFAVGTVGKLSEISPRMINDTGNMTVSLEFSNAQQQLIRRNGLYAVSNRQSDIAPNLVSGTPSPGMTYSNASPTAGAGYYEKGHITLNADPDAGEGAMWICTAAGTPGTHEPVANLRLQSTVGYTGETIAAGAFGSEVTITLNGVGVGDFLLSLAPSVLSQGEVWLGRISGSNQVKARPLNMTSGSITTTSGNIRVRAQKL